MVQGSTPAHKGLSPSRFMAYIPVSQRHPCRAHTYKVMFFFEDINLEGALIV